MRRVIALTLILSTATGCVIGLPATRSEPKKEITPPAPPAPIQTVTKLVDTYCSTYVPVYTSKQDTEETKRQVDKNNAVWLERCDEQWQKDEAARKAGEKG